MSYIVSICGGTGSGKSSLTRRLAAEWGDMCNCISHDNYYKHEPGMTPEQRAVYNFDEPAALDSHLLVEDLRRLRAGQSTEIPVYDFVTQSRMPQTIHLEPTPIVIVEGILIMAEPQVMEQVDLKIFIDTPEDVRLERRLRRDVEERGWTRELAEKSYRDLAKPAHDMYVQPHRAKADIVLMDSLLPAAVQVLAAGIPAAAAKRQ